MRRHAIIMLTVMWLMLGIVPTPRGRTWAASDAAALKSVTPSAETSARVAPPASSSGPLLVSKVTFDKHESGETFVDVFTSRSASYRVMTLPNPARLVVDIEGAQNTSPRNRYPVDTPGPEVCSHRPIPHRRPISCSGGGGLERESRF